MKIFSNWLADTQCLLITFKLKEILATLHHKPSMMFIITVIVFILIVQNSTQYLGNSTNELPGTCTIDQQTCADLMMNSENGVKVINKKIGNYFRQRFSGSLTQEEFYSTHGFDSTAYNDLKKIITTSIIYNLQDKMIQKAVDGFRQFKDSSIVEEIVNSIFLTTDFNAIIEFLRKIKEPIAYHYTFNEIIKNNSLYTVDLLQFAEAVKYQLNLCRTGKCLEILHGIKEKFPEIVTKIVFPSKQSVCIKNIIFDEFLYAETFLHMEDRRLVFTKISDKTKVPEKGGLWQLEPIENGAYYQIKNIYYNEYLYVMQFDDYDSSRRRVVTWVPGTVIKAGKWKFELFNRNSINIRNVAFNNEYFYAAYGEYDKERRYVFSWVDNIWDEQCTWTIVEC